MTKSLDDYWIDWENHVFGFGYGSGEPHTIPALKRFFELIGVEATYSHCYDYTVLKRELGPQVAWLLINILCHADIIEYGTSPRFGWLTPQGKALKAYIDTKAADELIELACGHDENHEICYPTACNCGPNGYEEGKVCGNPFWIGR